MKKLLFNAARWLVLFAMTGGFFTLCVYKWMRWI
jgi:hypothetical protein